MILKLKTDSEKDAYIAYATENHNINTSFLKILKRICKDIPNDTDLGHVLRRMIS